MVDPTPELPVPQEAHRGDSVLVALLPPLPEQSALRVVAAFFRAVVTEDSEALSVLMTADANVSSNGRSPPSAMLDHWRGRLRHFKYQSLAAETLYQTADVESYRFRNLEVFRAGRPARPAKWCRAISCSRSLYGWCAKAPSACSATRSCFSCAGAESDFSSGKPSKTFRPNSVAEAQLLRLPSSELTSCVAGLAWNPEDDTIDSMAMPGSAVCQRCGASSAPGVSEVPFCGAPTGSGWRKVPPANQS